MSAALREVPLAAPAVAVVVDLDVPGPDLDVAGARTVFVLAREGGVPVAQITVAAPDSGRLERAAVRAAASVAVAPAATASVPAAAVVPASAPATAAAAPAAAGRAVSVVVTTCRAPERTRRCVASILAGTHAPLEVMVVENRPGTTTTADMLSADFGDDPRVRLVEEARAGLSWARNAGLAAARGNAVAFTDDDVVADPGWLARAVAGFARAGDVGCVTGMIMPLALDTPERVLLEQFAGFGKGIAPRVVRLADAAGDPLAPYTMGQVGSGANLLLDTALLRRVGGFDVHLGTGTRARGGEDLDLLTRVLDAGAAIAYEPSAIVWHEHPDGAARLRRQVRDYGAGLTAMLAKQLLAGPHRGRLLRAVPAGLRYGADPGSAKNARKPAGYPPDLERRERLGMLLGPFGYVASVAATRRAGRWRPGA